MDLQIGFATHRGRVRKSNQDSVGVFQPQAGLFGRRGLPLFVLADGMGGHRGGEVASRVAVHTIAEVFDGNRGAAPGEALQAAILAANQAVKLKAEASPPLSSMGTTVVAAAVTGDWLYVGNVGDSRAYIIHGEEIRRITRDHSFVEERVRAGYLTEEEAATARGRNVLTRSVGRRARLQVDLFEEPWQENDVLVMCSDGLWGVVSDAQLLAVAVELAPQTAAEKLVKMAMTAQSRDNISVVIVRHL